MEKCFFGMILSPFVSDSGIWKQRQHAASENTTCTYSYVDNTDGSYYTLQDYSAFTSEYSPLINIYTDSNGLYYMRTRYYNPDIKLFINQNVVEGNITNSPTSILPSIVSAINVTSESTGFPSTSKGLPVALFIRTPFIVYSLPIVRFL